VLLLVFMHACIELILKEILLKLLFYIFFNTQFYKIVGTFLIDIEIGVERISHWKIAMQLSKLIADQEDLTVC
jgi:hypothetical protein